MKSRIAYTNKRLPAQTGFTLVEVIVVIAIITALFAIGSFVDPSIMTRRSISAEQAVLVSVLQKARNESMNNIDHVPHGVHIDVDSYTLYEGTYPSAADENIIKNSKISVSGINDITFAQLSGNPSKTGDIVLSDGTITRKISIVNGGLIDW